MNKLIIFVILSMLSYNILGQNTYQKITETKGIKSHALEAIKVDNIGPSVFGGRVVDIAVNPENTNEFYVAYASGGLWHTVNNGNTFTPIFDHEQVMTIGDIDIHWESNTIYLGSGEVNSSRSSYAGNGVYKTNDNGENWKYLGLPESHHIGRVIINENNPDIVSVAVLGHLYTANEERGMYKTTDGGKTWTQTLYVNENAGAVDLVAHPVKENILYAAIWERTRRAWNFTEAGAGSGIYKSMDNGDTWSLISGVASDFPQGEGTGRIGLSVYADNNETLLYVILDNYDRRPPESKDYDSKLEKDDFTTMGTEAFARLKDKDLNEYLEQNGFKDYDATKVKKMVADGDIKPVALKEYVEDANRMLFDTPVIGAEVYLLKDDAESKWSKTHKGYLDALYNSYGYYFGQIRVNPSNKEQLYIMGVPILRSDDGGANWKNVNGDNVHVDHHALWINPKNTDHIINGNDGGVNISYDAGENWIKCNSPAVGQFYYVNIDQTKDYKVYGGTQDNGVWVGDGDYERGVRWQMTGSYPYNTIMGGDGMQVQIDNRDNTTVYTGFQFGNYFRINTTTQERTYITPKHKLGDRPYRWNWQSPILLSSHNQDIVYFGANKLLRSMDKGETFTEISEDLTNGGKKGDVAFATLTTISESPLKFGLIYTGSDDGKIHVTKDGGHSWTNISNGLPDGLWVSRVTASAFSESRVYASVNGYRNDIFDAYVFVSNDYGSTWDNIATDLPPGPVNVVKEDPNDENTIYIGTDHGTFISLDMGDTYIKVGSNIPNVPVHDLVVHKESRDLIIGTHGRSIYRLNMTAVQKGIKSGKALAIFGEKEFRYSSRWGYKRAVYSEPYTPEYNFDIYAQKGGSGTLTIYAGNKAVKSVPINIAAGVSSMSYDLTIDSKKQKDLIKHHKKDNEEPTELKMGDDGNYYLLPGKYRLELSAGSHKAEHTLTIK